MRFVISYKITKYSPVRWSIVWEDGKLSGEPLSVHYLEQMLKYNGDRPYMVSPTGPWNYDDPEKNGLAFLVFCQNLLLGVRVTGDIPILPPVPPHSIA